MSRTPEQVGAGIEAEIVDAKFAIVETVDELKGEVRELRRSIDALAAVILVASRAKLDGVPFREAKPMGPDYVGQAQFVMLVREEFE